jgi:hypothetical protein
VEHWLGPRVGSVVALFRAAQSKLRVLFLSLLLAVLVWKKENEEDDISRVFGNNLLRNGKAFV